MSRCYYYSDIAEMIETLLVLDREVETIATEMIGAGMSINGFSGITARKIQERFLSDYSLLKQNQIRTRENTFKVLQYISDIFLEIDNSPWAVIHFDQLERNDQYIISMFQELEEEIINYNQLVSRAALNDLYLETISRSLPDVALEDLKDFTWKLSDRLLGADEYASNAIRELLSDYEDIIVKILCMFDVSVRTKLTKVVKGSLSTQMLVNIEEKVERTELEKHLRKNKAALMKELYIETEEEYEEYIKGALINLALYNKYKDRITELEQMTFEERYEAYPLGGGNPQTELLFLMQLNGYSMEAREAILRRLKINGEINEADLKRITGSSGGGSFLGISMEEAGLELLYRGSIMNMSWNEMVLESNEIARKDRDAFWAMLMLTWGIKASELQINPPANNENLDPSVRLDQMEINSQNGFKSYDYVQIPADSLPTVSVVGAGTSGGDTVPTVNKDLSEELTRAQNRNVNKLDNIIENNLAEGDFSGTLADLEGNPIPKINGGYWDHLTEMKQSYSGLTDVKSGLEGSLKNPTLSKEVRAVLQDNLDTTNYYINKIEELFKPFGGIE